MTRKQAKAQEAVEQPKVRLYCAGPITGIPGANRQEFDRVASLLRQAGYEVVSPLELDDKVGLENPEALNQQERTAAIVRDLQAITDCDGIVLLPGWRASKGARTEKALAEFLGLQVYEWVEDENGARLKPSGQTALEEAQALVYGARSQSYGHPRENFGQIAGYWNAHLARKLSKPISPADVGWMMVMVKASRDSYVPQRDNRVDACGYAETIERLYE